MSSTLTREEKKRVGAIGKNSTEKRSVQHLEFAIWNSTMRKFDGVVNSSTVVRLSKNQRRGSAKIRGTDETFTTHTDCSPIPDSLGRMYTPVFSLWNPFSFPVPLLKRRKARDGWERAEWSDVSSACLCLTPRIFPLNFPDARIYHRSQSRKNLLRLCNAIPITIAPAGSCEMYRTLYLVGLPSKGNSDVDFGSLN